MDKLEIVLFSEVTHPFSEEDCPLFGGSTAIG